MNPKRIISLLSLNQSTFSSLFRGLKKEEYLFKKDKSDWCILEIAAHLYDEEREDFRMRLQTVLESPFKIPPMIDPEGWVKQRDYINKDYKTVVNAFKNERKESLKYLNALKNASWDNYYEHPTLGNLDGYHFLRNWLAHDYLHIRQLTQRKYQFLQYTSANECSYAGTW